jgi:hypothetical protein
LREKAQTGRELTASEAARDRAGPSGAAPARLQRSKSPFAIASSSLETPSPLVALRSTTIYRTQDISKWTRVKRKPRSERGEAASRAAPPIRPAPPFGRRGLRAARRAAARSLLRPAPAALGDAAPF